MRTLVINTVNLAGSRPVKIGEYRGTLEQIQNYLGREYPGIPSLTLRGKILETLAHDEKCVMLGFNRVGIELVEISPLGKREGVAHPQYNDYGVVEVL